MAKVTLPTIAGGYASVSQLNTAFDQLESELQSNILYRNNPVGEPNQMENDLDMNSNDILNAGVISCSDLTVDGSSVASAADAAQASANAAALSETAAATSAAAALVSETAAAASAVAVEDAKLIWRGGWSALTTYAINDAVSYNGSSWISLQNGNLNNTPADDAFWDYLAQRGAAGAGTGDVIGPASATSNSLARYDGTTGKLLKDGAVIGTDVQAYSAKLASYAAKTLTAANKVPYATALNTASELDFKDEDDMLSNSATAVASQQSIKAYADTKNIATQVTPGTSGNVLTSNGTAWVSAAPAASGAWEKVSSVAVTAVASIDFDLQETIYGAWMFVIDGVIPGTDNSMLLMRPGYSAGTVFETAGCDARLNDTSSTISPWTVIGGVRDDVQIDYSGGVGTAAGEHCHATITIGGLGSTLAGGFAYESKCSFIDGQRAYQVSQNIKGIYVGRTARVFDSVRFLWSTGNFEASGTITMYGLLR